MKKQLRYKLQLAGLLLLGMVGKTTHGNAQAYDISHKIESPASNASNSNVNIQLYQNCMGGIGALSNLPVSLIINNVGNTEIISGYMPWRDMAASSICNSVSYSCSGTGIKGYQASSAIAYTPIFKINASGAGFTNVSVNLFPGFGYGNYQAANINGTYKVQPETFSATTLGMSNRPPYFGNEPVIFVNVNKPVSYSCASIDPDGDSLVYRLRPVSPNATYASGFSYQNPITANPALALNSRTGEITFTPTHYDQTAGIGGVGNTYIVGIDVDEYRKINGQATKIGTIQRNMLVNVINNANQTPVLTAYKNGTPIGPNTIIDVIPGTPVALNFSASDPNTFDTVVPVTNAQSVLPGSNFIVTLAQNPNGGLLTWTPTAAHARPEPYFFNVSAVDNACPYPASSTSTFGIRVRNLAGTKKDIAGADSFYAYPNPFSHEVRFKLNNATKVQAIEIYNSFGQLVDRIEIKNRATPATEVQWDYARGFAAGTYIARLVSANGASQACRFNKIK